jgi:heat shock protein HtpX
MLLVLPLLALLGVAVLAVGGIVLALLVLIAGVAFYMVGAGPVAIGALATGATDVDTWGTVEWSLVAVWFLIVLVGIAAYSGSRIRLWLGSFVGDARSLADPRETLFTRTPTHRPTSDRLATMTTALAQQADLPVPEIVVAETDTPEALTVGYRPMTTTLVVTDGLLSTLDDHELRAAVAHELAHVKNRDAALMTAATSVVAGARRLRRYAWGTDRDADLHVFAVVVSLLLVPVTFLARVLVASLSRSREIAADRGAVAITGDPAGLASALGTLDSTLDDPPGDDLRHGEVVALSIVPPVPESVESKLAWERRRPVLWGLRRPIRRALILASRRAYSTHPPTVDRIDRLQSLERTAG